MLSWPRPHHIRRVRFHVTIGILAWASEKPDPAKALLGWARKRSRGYYRTHRRRPNGTEKHGRCLAHLRRKEAEAVEKRGSGLTQGELEEFEALEAKSPVRTSTIVGARVRRRRTTCGRVKLRGLTPARVQALYRAKLDSGLSLRTVQLNTRYCTRPSSRPLNGRWSPRT